MFDMRKGEALLAVIDSGSFEQAANLLHLTPSAISQRISSLESECGSPLLIRAKPCRPTALGQRFAQYLRRSRLLEQEWQLDLQADDALAGKQKFVSIAIAVNNDTLATWLLPAVGEFLLAQQIVLEILLDDQDHTFNLLTQGLALAGISSASAPMRGCVAQPLGLMRYRMLATPAFAQSWFAQGLQRDCARHAPLLVFDRKDGLQADFLQQHLGLLPDSYPCHYLPASDAFFRALCMGLGYGLIPEAQYGSMLDDGKLLDLMPGKVVDVALYWHSWRVQSEKLERLSEQVVRSARSMLRQQ
jgi:LysR family transcriptional regulator (chromosome initiation inhibitor)